MITKGRAFDFYKAMSFKKDEYGIQFEFPSNQDLKNMKLIDKLKLFWGGTIPVRQTINFIDKEEVKKIKAVKLVSDIPA